jgi:thiamine kinase-like enzyme
MKHDEPSIKRNIAKCVEENYRIEIKTIDFIPIGEESYAYVVSDKNKSNYFVKYCAKNNVIKNINITNKLLLKLKHLDFVVPPIEVNGQTSFSLLNGKLYLFPYITGKNITSGNHEWTKSLTSKIVDMMVKIHNSTNLLNFKLPEEQFKNRFTERLNRLLDSIKSKSISDKEISEFLAKNKTLIRNTITQHAKLGDKYRNSDTQFVLTHGDITGLNIIDTGTSLKLVDWDGAMLAPAERDINFFSSNPHFSIDRYLKKTSNYQYNQELVDYYGQQWTLDSIVGNFEMLLSEQSKYIDRKESIDEIKEYLSYCE